MVLYHRPDFENNFHHRLGIRTGGENTVGNYVVLEVTLLFDAGRFVAGSVRLQSPPGMVECGGGGKVLGGGIVMAVNFDGLLQRVLWVCGPPLGLTGLFCIPKTFITTGS